MTDVGKCEKCGAIMLRLGECPALCAPPPVPAPKYKGPKVIGITHTSRLGKPVYTPELEQGGWIGAKPNDS